MRQSCIAPKRTTRCDPDHTTINAGEPGNRAARYFGNSARFYLNLQTAYELAPAEAELNQRIVSEVTPAAV